MMAATHRLGGAAIGMAATSILLPGNSEPLKIAALVGGAVLGSLISDIDNHKSSISRKIPIVSMIVSIFQMAVRGIAELLPAREEKHIRGIVGHRGITHSFTMLIISTIALGVIGKMNIVKNISEYKYFAIGIVLGMASHIFLDMFAGGVPLFCPVTNKRVTLAHIKTGGVIEWVLRTVSIVVFIFVLHDKINILTILK